MATYKVTDPSTGRTVRVTGDSPPTESELKDIFSSIPSGTNDSLKPWEQIKQSATDVMEKPGVLPKIWESLTVPEKVAKAVLPKLTQIQSQAQNAIAKKTGLPIQEEPTGNLARDLVAGTPRIIGETGEKVIPQMINRPAIVTAGVLKAAQTAAPLLKMIGKGVASQAESLSGAKEGMAKAAYNAPLLKPLFIQPGTKAASPLYEAAKAEMDAGASLFSDTPKNADIFDKAVEFINKGGKLEPSEALTARKAADALYNSKAYSKDIITRWRDIFDSIAKTSSNIAEADPAFKQGLLAESARKIIPQNIKGGASAFKAGILTGLEAIAKTGGIPKIVARTVQASMSPAAVGAAATVAGDVAKIAKPIVENPSVGPVLNTVVKNLSISKAKEWLKEIKKNAPDISDDEAKDMIRKRAKAEGLSIPKK